MSKIVFVNSISFRPINVDIPLGILSLATTLKAKNYEVNIIDFNYLWLKNYCKKGTTIEENIEIMYEYIERFKPDIVGFYCMCDSYPIVIMLSKYLKEKNHNIKIMFGGPQASLTSEITLQKFPWVDLICIGEGESTVESIVKALENNTNFEIIPGITYRKDGNVVSNSELMLIEDLDNLPFLDYSLVNIDDYRSILIDAGRGCPYGCTYCSTKTFWKRKFRLKSPYRLVKELKYLNENYNKSVFELIHDLFTLKKANVIEFCNLIIKENIDVKWGCSARADTLDEEMISKMREAGCNSIFIGIETGSQRMQKLINKNLDISRVHSVIDILNKYKYKITVSFIYGFENETYEDLEQTLNIMDTCMKKGCKIVMNKCTVLVGTELYENVKNNLELEDQFSMLTYIGDTTYCKSIIKENPQIFPSFYTFKTELRTELEFLEVFISYFYVFLYKGLNSTYDFLMNFYENNILNFYREFKDVNPNFTSELFDNSKSNLLFNRLEILEKYINQCDFNDYSGVIKDVFKYESSVVRLKYNDNLAETICTFDYNIFKIKTSGSNINTGILEPMKIKLYKTDNRKIQVQIIS